MSSEKHRAQAPALKGPTIPAQDNALGAPSPGTGPEGADHTSPGQRPGVRGSDDQAPALKGPTIPAQGNALGSWGPTYHATRGSSTNPTSGILPKLGLSCRFGRLRARGS